MMFSRELPTHLVTRRSVALALASDRRHGQDCGAQIERLGKFPVRREVAENTDIGEHHLGGKFRRFPAEQRRQAPSGVDGDRSPVRRCGGRRPRISEPCASAPAQAVPFQNLQRFLAGRDRQRRQQEPRLAARIFLLFDMNQRNRLHLPCGRREIHHAPAQGDPCVAGLPSVFGFLARALLRAEGSSDAAAPVLHAPCRTAWAGPCQACGRASHEPATFPSCR